MQDSDVIDPALRAFLAEFSLFDISSFIIAVVTSLALLAGLYLSRQSQIQGRKAQEAQVYFTVGEKWSKTLNLLYAVRAAPPSSLAEIEAQFGTAYSQFMATPEWRETYRPICNFFEDIGLLVYKRNISLETVRVLVTISEEDYVTLRPVLDYLRKHYRADIYSFWNYLLQESSKTDALHPFSAPHKIYQPSASEARG